MNKKIFAYFFFLLFFTSTAFAELPFELQAALKSKNYKAAGAIIGASTVPIAIAELEQCGDAWHLTPLKKALRAVRHMLSMDSNVGIQKNTLLQLCLYIETDYRR